MSNLKVRAIALFFLANFLTSLFAPTVAWALTTGPSSPEFCNFESVDANNLVQIETGDLTYNIPTVSVPGPSGGYAMSMSYHAGIKPEQEASWVGLGWTLNPGAINRNPNGVADDLKNITQYVTDYVGNSQQDVISTTHTFGVSAYGVGMSWDRTETTVEDSYKGSSTYISLGSTRTFLGISSHEDGQGNEDIGISYGFLNGHADPKSTKFVSNLLLSMVNEEAIDLNGLSGGGAETSNAGGASAGINNNKISIYSNIRNKSTSGNGFLTGVYIGYAQTKYTRDFNIFGNDKLISYGSLYQGPAGDAISTDNHLTNPEYNISSDFSPIIDKYQRIDDFSNMDKIKGGTLAYDSYSVLGQGISGSISPKVFEGVSVMSSQRYKRLYFGDLHNFRDERLQFNFLGDFSGSVRINPSTQTYNAGTKTVSLTPQTLSLRSASDYSYATNKLATGKNIEWYTNKDIRDIENNPGLNTSGLIIHTYNVNSDENYSDKTIGNGKDYEAIDENRCLLTYDVQNYFQHQSRRHNDNGSMTSSANQSTYWTPNFDNHYNVYDVSDQLGGFKITNEFGFTYHYTIPVYSYDEVNYLEGNTLKGSTIPSKRVTFNDQPYAYTWLLTSITGPDFVDRGIPGKLDDLDWGYWTEFNYGRWAKDYKWRIPNAGYQTDPNTNIKTFSSGRKELYYLNSVRTKTHTALFVKEMRNDAKGLSNLVSCIKPFFDVAHANGGEPTYYNYINHINNDISSAITTQYQYSNSITTESYNGISKQPIGKIRVNKGGDFLPHYCYNKEFLKYTKYHPASALGSANENTLLTNNYYDQPVSTLRLKKVLILTNTGLNKLAKVNSIDEVGAFSLRNLCERSAKLNTHVGSSTKFNHLSTAVPACKQVVHIGANILDNYDIEGIGNSFLGNQHSMESPIVALQSINEYIIKSIELTHDYSLCPQTPNSYNFASLVKVKDRTPTVQSLLVEEQYNARVYYKAREMNSATGDDAGYTNPYYYQETDNNFTLTGKLTLKSIKTYGKGGADLIPATFFAYNAGPSYTDSHDKIDNWGYYYSKAVNSSPDQDFISSQKTAADANTDASAWALAEITTPQGAKIKLEYESDSYSNVAYQLKPTLSVKEYSKIDNDKIAVTFNQGIDATQYFKANETVNLNLLLKGVYTRPKNLGEGTTPSPSMKFFSTNLFGVPIISVAFNSLTNTSTIVIEGTIDDSFSNVASTTTITPVIHLGSLSPGKFNGGEFEQYGGGYRVKSISVEAEGAVYKTNYDYTETNGSSSGSTTFAPFKPDMGDKAYVAEPFLNSSPSDELLNNYQDNFDNYFDHTIGHYKNLMEVIQYIPAPGVMYSKVTVSKVNNNIERFPRSSYYFEPFAASMVQKDIIDNEQASSAGALLRTIVISNFSSRTGLLNKVENIGPDGSIISVKVNKYLHNDYSGDYTNPVPKIDAIYKDLLSSYNFQGVMHESFHEGKTVCPDGNCANANVSSVILVTQTYPVICTGTISEDNLKTKIKKEETILAYDFFSGSAIRSLFNDGYGNIFVKESTPAYVKYPKMGPQSISQANRNTLSNNIESKVYKRVGTDYTNYSKLVNATYSTYVENTHGKYNSDKDFVFFSKDANMKNSDGTINATGYAIPVASPYTNWLNTGITTKLSSKSHILESSDVNGRYSSALMDPKENYVIASATNAAYNEIAYSGAEFIEGTNAKEGNVSNENGVPSSAIAHTGKFSLQVPENSDGFKFTLNKSALKAGKKYLVSAWVYLPNSDDLNKIELASSGDVSPGATNPTENKKAGSWYFIRRVVTVTSANASDIVFTCKNKLSTPVNFDDFKVQPLNSTMTAFVYNQDAGELTHILNNDNLFSRFEYDALGQLKKTYTELFKYSGERPVSSQKYNYKN